MLGRFFILIAAILVGAPAWAVTPDPTLLSARSLQIRVIAEAPAQTCSSFNWAHRKPAHSTRRAACTNSANNIFARSLTPL